MDEPSAKTRVHLSETYSRVIKDIENLEDFMKPRYWLLALETYPRQRQYTLDQNRRSPKRRSLGILIYMALFTQVTALIPLKGAGTQTGITDPILPWPILQSRPR